jgi:hypothetical protein
MSMLTTYCLYSRLTVFAESIAKDSSTSADRPCISQVVLRREEKILHIPMDFYQDKAVFKSHLASPADEAHIKEHGRFHKYAAPRCLQDLVFGS